MLAVPCPAVIVPPLMVQTYAAPAPASATLAVLPVEFGHGVEAVIVQTGVVPMVSNFDPWQAQPLAVVTSTLIVTVPLAPAVIRLLGKPGKPDEFVFPSRRYGARKAPHQHGMLNTLKALRPGYVVHGFRSTFRDWAAERTNFPREVAEMALAHSISNAVEAASLCGINWSER